MISPRLEAKGRQRYAGALASAVAILGCAFSPQSTMAQTGTAQKGAVSSGAVMQKQGAASASTQQNCGKPNAQGVTVLCPGNKASGTTGNPVGNPGGVGIGSHGGPSNSSARIPGAGGSQDKGRQSGPAQPTAQELAEKMKKEKSPEQSAKGKEVGPDYFSREKQLKDLANPARGVNTPASGAANAATNPLKGAAPTVGTVGVGRGDGKNEVSKQEQAGHKSKEGRQNDKEWREFNQSGYNPKTDSADSAPREVPKGKAPGEGDDERPDPMAGGGSGAPLPKGVSGKDPKKSPEQMQAERKRQVTVPSENQRRPTERVTVSAETARAMGKGGNTSGNINPGPGDGTSGNAPGTKLKPGIEKVDGTTGGGGTGPSATGQ